MLSKYRFLIFTVVFCVLFALVFAAGYYSNDGAGGVKPTSADTSNTPSGANSCTNCTCGEK